METSRKIRALFYGSLLTSFLLHLLALFFFQRCPLWFSAPSEEREIPWVSSMDKEQFLKEAFDELATEESALSPSYTPSLESPPLSIHKELSIPTPPEKKLLFSSPPLREPLLGSQEKIVFSLSWVPALNLLEHLPQDLLLPPPSLPQPHQPPLFPSSLAKPELSFEMAPPPLYKEPFATAPPLANRLLDQASLSQSSSPAKSLSFTPLPTLPQLPTLDELETLSCSDAFDTELTFLPQEEGGYLFALTLIPQSELKLSKLRQHYTFLIDRSNSIQRERLSAVKNAVQRALVELDPDDTFNVIAFDSRMEKFSPFSLRATPQTIDEARKFIENVQLGNFFSPADLSNPLFLTIPSRVEEGELHTAILLTDGESLSKKSSQQALLMNWSAYNEGRVSLFGIGVGGEQLEMLDAAVALNRGKLLYTNTKRGIKRKLLKLMKKVRLPVAKNLSCHAVAHSSSVQIQLFPKTAPHLYLNEPYVLIGTIDKLEDFTLFVQGHLKDRWLNIKKKISFLNAKKAHRSLRRECLQQQAYLLYEAYTLDGNPQHLAQARELLEQDY